MEQIIWFDAISKAGVTIVILYALFLAWKAYREAKSNTQKLLIFRIATISPLVFILCIGAIELFKHSFYRKVIDEEISRKVDDFLFGKIFDPQQTPGSNKYEYRHKAPNGYQKDIDIVNATFQDFVTEHLVLRLWADPQKPESAIRADRVDFSNEKNLRVRFIRQGWGCDVTIKQKFNKTVWTKRFQQLVLEIRADKDSIDQLKSEGKVSSLGFGLRLVDGRGNHWAWGQPTVSRSNQSVKVSYSYKDSNNKPLHFLYNNSERFFFNINSHNSWTIFDADGSAAPVAPMDSTVGFDFIQAIVIEPGMVNVDENTGALINSKNPNENQDGHHRQLLDSPPISKNPDKFIEGVLYIKKISFKGEPGEQ
jgi:hypothetical protein